MFVPQQQKKARKAVDIKQTKFNKGYISTLADSRIPNDALSDTTNITLEQDGLPRPRPSLVAYGQDLLGTCIGMGTFTKLVAGVPERWEISMQVIGGVGKVHVRKDGETWTAAGGAGNTYDDEAWCMFTQTNDRVYVSNATDAMSYYNISTGNMVVYTALATPGTPTATRTNLGTNTFTYYYKVSANNAVGETAASAAGTVQVSKLREQWNGSGHATPEYVTVTWSSVASATSYNIYVGDTSGSEYYLGTTSSTTFIDDNTQLINTFRLFPSGDSTTGPKLKYLYNKNAQLFGVGDPSNPSYLWYSGSGQQAGDFSPFNGGGYVAINYGGDTLPVSVRSFRDGKGTPVVTVLSKGAAGQGKLHHVSFNTQTVGDSVIVYPEVYEANGQSGTVSPFAVVEADNSLIYPTGTDFKSTGTRANVVNILSTRSIAQGLEDDLARLNQDAMDMAVGIEYENKIYFALPVGADENNEIWVHDLSRNGLWILRWTVSAKHMWLYEDNSGDVHFQVLTSDNKTLEFTRTVATQDDGEPFRTRVKSGGIVFDPGGVSMASIEFMRFKFLYPSGSIDINVAGIGEDGPIGSISNDTYTTTVSFTGWGQLMWSDPSLPSMWSDDVGTVDFFSQSVTVVPLEIDEIVNQLEWEITTETANSDYILSSVNTTGKFIDGLYYGD